MGTFDAPGPARPGRLLHATKSVAARDAILATSVIKAGRNIVDPQPMVHFSRTPFDIWALDAIGDRAVQILQVRWAWIFTVDLAPEWPIEPDPADPDAYGEWVVVRAPEVPVTIVGVETVDVQAWLRAELPEELRSWILEPDDPAEMGERDRDAA